MVPGHNFHLYVIIVGYSQYVSLNIKVGRQQKPPYGGIHKKHFLENLSTQMFYKRCHNHQVDSVNVLEATSEALNST